MNKNVVISIENKVRELDGKIWLGLNFVERGYNVTLGPSWEIIPTIDVSQPDVYISKDPGDGNVEFFTNLREAGAVVCGLPPECGVNSSSLENYSKNKGKTLGVLDAYFSWGEAPAEAMQSRYTESKDRVYVTGNPRFDLLGEQLRDVYINKKKSETYGDYIQVNTSFPWGNPFDREKRRSAVRELYPDQNIKDKEQLYSRVFHLFIELIIYLSGNLSQNIIVRPHPGENFEMYEETINHLGNVHIEPFDDPRSWIYESNGVIHFDCTTGVESALMEKPTLSYQPISNTTSSDSDILSQVVSDTATTQEEVLEWIKTSAVPGNKHLLSNAQQERLMDFFPNITELAAPKICNIVEEKVADAPGFSTYHVPIKKKLAMQMKNSKIGSEITVSYDYLCDLKYKLKNVEKNRKQMRKKRQQKFPGLEREELRDKVRSFKPKIGVSSVEIDRVPRTKYSYTIKNADH
jgi:surface carbohydrate biosynthesis protein